MFNRVMRRIGRLLHPPKKVQVDPTQNVSETAILDNVRLGRYNVISKQSHLINVEIGDYSYLAGFNALMNVSIGKFCSIAQGVTIGPGRHPASVFVSTSPVFFSTVRQCGTSFADTSYFSETGKVVIGNDVWIGLNAVILDDVVIGDGAIVAAGAIVTGNVAPYSIVGGMPAKLIRYRFDENQIAFLTRDQWWNKDERWLREHFKKFHNIDMYREFMESNTQP